LSFLQKVIAWKETTNSLTEEQEQDLSSTLPSPVPKNKQDPVGERLVGAVEKVFILAKNEKEKWKMTAVGCFFCHC
jgi:hypothetical protein